MRTQAIAGILHDGDWITKPPLIKDVFLNYYKDKFQAHDSQVIFTPISSSPTLCHHDRDFLESHISLDEVKKAVWECGSNKAPDFRPISLIGTHYKIISKLLANRLSKVIDNVVSKEQSTFILGRQILDGLLIINEIIQCPTFEFSIKRGLRQGDPLSPFLFILVMEGLYCAMSNAVSSGLIRGIKLGSSGIVLSHLFYADDVIITTDWNHHDIDNIIRVFHVFHLASGLKINIHKSNIFGIGVTTDEISSMASWTSCAAGCFPFTYLGLPIGANMNLTSSWQILIDRFQKRLSSWKANLLSIGGRLTLIKVVLGSLGIYHFSIFKAPETILNTMESLRSRFFWGGSQDSKNMAWVKWSQVLSSFEKGGLNISSLKAFNLALPQKWRWRLLSSQTICGFLLSRRYMVKRVAWIFRVVDLTAPGLGLLVLLTFCTRNVSFLLTLFVLRWDATLVFVFAKDIWIGDSPLHTRYNRLYRLDKDKDCLINDRIVNGKWQWNWSRTDIGTRNTAYLNNLLLEISQIDISVDEDTCTWLLANDGIFSVKSARRLIDSKLLPSIQTPTVWDKFLPRKVNIFLWRLSLDSLPHRLNLSSRGLDIPTISCSSCNGNVESADHVFFECDLVKEIWCLVRKWCDIFFSYICFI
ncbi:putative RNA-directed DNA polymerase, eukaryota, reverse transcriptase zinc-binding domain protein [Tanacetum coccineum]